MLFLPKTLLSGKVVGCNSMESRGKALSLKCCCAWKVDWLVMREWHIA